MYEIEIEKDVPIPLINTHRNKYPWLSMEIGDSFVAEEKVQAAITYANARYKPKRFTSRKMTDGTYRAWRIE